MEKLELRMYFFVPYNISEIQKGIQAGHAALEYAFKYKSSPLYKEFVKKHKTWVILNGGTTNNDLKNMGTLQKSYNSILEFNITHTDNKIDVVPFYEPDLNNAMSSFCFIADQRVWDYLNYPDKDDFMNIAFDVIDIATDADIEEQEENWKFLIGGEKNIFLRELIKGKRLA